MDDLQIPYPADMTNVDGAWGVPAWQGPRASPPLPVQV